MRVAHYHRIVWVLAAVAFGCAARLSAAEQPGYAVVSRHSLKTPPEAKGVQPIPVSAEGLRMLQPEISRSPVRLVGHETVLITIQAKTDSLGSVPPAVWSRELPTRRSIVRVQ